jgi:hypothetical protein
MPGIPDHTLNCSVYFYNSVRAGQDGEHHGGSGFLAHVPSEHPGNIHLYAVTNKHVIDGGFHVLRFTDMSGRSQVLESKPEDWRFHADGDDIAVKDIEPGDRGVFRLYSVNTDAFVSKGVIEDFAIGPGDEAFLIGRLITVEGQQRNKPAARFGNISIMADPNEPIRLEGREQEAFLVECRSLSGFSGSPVFVTLDRTYHFTTVAGGSQNMPGFPGIPTSALSASEGGSGVRMRNGSLIYGTIGPWLLGIDCAHVPLWKPVYQSDRETKDPSGLQVETNTGIACVIPAWRILDLLNDEDLVKARKRDDAEIAKRKEGAAILDGGER